MNTELSGNQQENDDCEFVYIRSLNDLEKVTPGKLVLLKNLGIATCTSARDGSLEFSVDAPNRELIVSLTGSRNDAILQEPFLDFRTYRTRTYYLKDGEEYFSRLGIIERVGRVV